LQGGLTDFFDAREADDRVDFAFGFDDFEEPPDDVARAFARFFATAFVGDLERFFDVERFFEDVFSGAPPGRAVRPVVIGHDSL